MLTKENFTMEHIENVRAAGKVDKTILERSIYALGLLEALVTVGMEFIFKGGTSLTLLLEMNFIYCWMFCLKKTIIQD